MKSIRKLKKSLNSNTRRFLDQPKLAKNLDKWMTNLPPRLKNISFIYLAIPGSHDSGTYAITSKSKTAEDAGDWMKMFGSFKFSGKFLRHQISKWAVTQKNNISTQLAHGIRYFDLRLSTKQGEKDFYICHVLYGNNVNECLNAVNAFLNKHPKEIVILDFQHFYGFRYGDHIRFLEHLKKIFGKKLVPFDEEMRKFTLNYLTVKNSYQVIVIYRKRVGMKYNHWPTEYFPTPWPNTTSLEDLFTKLEHYLFIRNVECGMVTQCVITPNAQFLIFRLSSTLHSVYINTYHRPIMDWLKRQTPQGGNINVVITDFVGLNNWEYCKTVVTLNEKI